MAVALWVIAGGTRLGLLGAPISAGPEDNVVALQYLEL
jgi:hypothetical protein